VLAPKESWFKPLWPVWIAIGFPLLLIVFNSTSLGPNFVFVMIGIPALLCVWVCWGIWTLIRTIGRIRRHEWSQAVISVILPTVILFAGLRFWNFIHFCNAGGDVVHFIVERPAYLKKIRATPPNGEPRLLVFNRGGMIWASRGYVYDESDEVMREGSRRSASWKARASNTELSCGYYAEPFPGQFSFTRNWYLASFNC
jgi:hypothetical protein